MELIRTLGLEPTFQDHSYPRQQSTVVSVGSSATASSLVFQLEFSSWGDAVDGVNDKPMILGFDRELTICPALLCPQFTQEPILKEYIDAHSQSDILWGYMATSIFQNDESVTIKAVSSNDYKTEKTITAKYAVGCDGGRSWVRRQLGIHNIGKFVVQRAASITFKSPELTQELSKLNRLGILVVMNETTNCVFVVLNTRGDFACHLILPPMATDEDMTERCRDAKKYVLAAIGRDIPVTIVDAHEYKMHTLITTKFREGRILLAGDAAHQWPPAGGLGLNAGYHDAANLSWKLTAMIQGWGGSHLLDSYQVERRPVCDETRRFAYRAIQVINDRSYILINTLQSIPYIRLVLNHMFSAQFQTQVVDSAHLVLGYRYADSNIIYEDKLNGCDSKGDETQGDNGKFVPVALPGSRAPHVILPETPTIHDIFGKGFVLLVIGGTMNDCEFLQEELNQRGVPFEVRVYPRLPDILKYYDRKYYLVRPDGHICWRSFSQPSSQESQNIVVTICGDIPFVSPCIKNGDHKIAPSFNFVSDIFIGFWVSSVLKRYTKLSELPLACVALGVASLSTILRNWPRSEAFEQGVSRHHIWKTTQFGAAETVLELEPSYVGAFGAKDVLIKVHAASVNPIDIGFRKGYGATMLCRFARKHGRPLFPLILGRDCSGEVVAVGDEVTGFSPGDQVYAAVSFDRQGTHAQYVSVDYSEVSHKPETVDHREAASIPWVAVAVWTALVKNGGLSQENARGKRILVHGGAGGIGSFAIQLLKSWGADVATTCSEANIPFVHSLGADVAIDYTSGDFAAALSKYSFDVVLDIVGYHYERPSISLLKIYGDAKYVSIRSPYFRFTNKLGSFLGTVVYQWYYRYKVVVNRLFGGRGFYYSIAEPDGKVLDCVKDMVERGDVRPIVGAVYSKDEMVAAHHHVESGHTRGKVVVSMI